MKIVAFEGQGGPRLGVVEGDQVVDLQAAASKVPLEVPARMPSWCSSARQAANASASGMV